MPARGLQHQPIRYPSDAPPWFVTFMQTFIRDVLTNLDPRNAIPGPGISIDGNSDQPATISASADLSDLFDENYVLAEPSTTLANARTLTAEDDVLEIVDSGPSGTIDIRVQEHGLVFNKMQTIAQLSVLGNPTDSSGNMREISAGDADTVLALVGTSIDFVKLTVDMAPDAVWTYAKIQDVSSDSVLLGRGDSGAGVIEEIALGDGLAMTGATLAVDIVAADVPYTPTSPLTATDVQGAIEEAVSLIAGGGYTDEMAQDAVGSILDDSSTIEFTYDDSTPSITAEVIDSSITYSKIQDTSTDSILLGRGDSGAGEVEEITIGSGLALTGTTLSATGGGGGGGGNVTADTHPSSPDAQDDEFESGSSIDTGKWTAFALSTGTTVVGQGALAFKPALTASRNIGGYVQPVTGSWGYTCKFSLANFNGSTSGGLIVATSSGASGKIILLGFAAGQILVQRLSNATTFSANQLLSGAWPNFTTDMLQSVPCYLRITYDGTNLRFWISATGIDDSFVQVYTETSAAFLGTPGLIGVAVDNESASIQSVAIYDWFRKTS